MTLSALKNTDITFLIQIGDLEITVLRKRVKNINLRIHTNGCINVSAPLRCSLDRIQQFIESKYHWITTQQAHIQSQPKQIAPKFINGERHLFLGDSYPLSIQDSAKHTYITLENNTLRCYIKANTPHDNIRKMLLSWYREQMTDLLPSLIAKWEPIIGVEVAAWGIRVMKTRWGSCNTRAKKIWLNLSLIQKPQQCLEYVLVHEMVHLLEASHNKRFYAYMSQFMPDWPNHKKQLASLRSSF
ncbi:MAG: M48 family metallopeptidase [Gammaproteobacteria bacterium]|nr:M48 family metallopeptidase [Gammaproteobacteria bacterium]